MVELQVKNVLKLLINGTSAFMIDGEEVVIL